MNIRQLLHLGAACGFSLLCAGAAGQATERYFAQLAYNHISPQVPLRGIHELKADEAERMPHYLLRYDAEGRLVELVRKHPEAWKQHPLAHVGKVYRIAFSYPPAREERRFFAEDGSPMRNIRGVFREEYEIAPDGFRSALRFYDEDAKPMNSNWKIARYAWERHDGLVIERRFDVDGRARPIAPYFAFGTTGIRYAANGLPDACFNLDDDLRVTNNPSGIASYHDRYVGDSDHLSWSYRDRDGKPALAGNYTTATKSYDGWGNVLKVEYFGLDGAVVREEGFSYPPAGAK